MNTNYKFGEVESITNVIDFADGKIQFRNIFETENGGISCLALKEGQNLDTHTTPFEVMISVLEGEINFTMIDQTKNIKAGQFLLMGANVPHSVKAKANSKVLLIKIKN